MSKLLYFPDAFQEQSLLPLLSGITQETVFLPLLPGNKYMLLVSAVDYVGNRQPLDLDRAITVDFELQKRKFETRDTSLAGLKLTTKKEQQQQQHFFSNIELQTSGRTHKWM